MSNLITEAHVQQYKDTILGLYQQQGSKFRGAVREVAVNAKQYFFERLGATAAIKRTTRHSGTPLVNSPHSRRMVTMTDYEWADLIDDFDKVRMLISPESEYARNAAYALGRAYDDEVIVAFTAVAKAGETGATDVTFASDYAATRSGTDGDWDFSAAALTLANILKLTKDLDEGDVPREGRFISISPAGLEQLLKQSTTPNVSSADYMMVKALVNGEINSGLGFERWITTTRLPTKTGDATQRYGFAWHRDSMGIAVGKDITGKIDVRPDMSYSTQVYACMVMGATRIQGEGVVRFLIDEDN